MTAMTASRMVRRRHAGTAGLTLVEIMIAMVIFAVVLFLAFDVTGRTAEFATIGSHKAWVQAKAQTGLDKLQVVLRESTADQVCPFRVTDPPSGQIVFENGTTIASTQVFVCFPIPRGANGMFALHDGSGNVLAEPRWQGISVIGYYQGSLIQYIQYGVGLPYSSTTPIRITSVTTTTITLSNGTTFNRANATGTNQTSRVLCADVAQLESPNYTTGNVLPNTQPLRLKLTVLDRVRTSRINNGTGYVAAASFETGVLARNMN